jgi:hypothetical protein
MVSIEKKIKKRGPHGEMLKVRLGFISLSRHIFERVLNDLSKAASGIKVMKKFNGHYLFIFMIS